MSFIQCEMYKVPMVYTVCLVRDTKIPLLMVALLSTITLLDDLFVRNFYFMLIHTNTLADVPPRIYR